MSISLNSKIPDRLHDKLMKAIHDGISNIRYGKAIKLLEKYRGKHKLDDKLMYQLGLLYDHEASVVEKNDPKLAETDLTKASRIYFDILRRDPKNFFAMYGLARVYANRKDFKTAIRWAKKAYHEKNKLPAGQRGSLPVGSFYERMGDLKNAELWYRKELKDLGKKEFGTVMNLLMFYNRTKQNKKAYRIAFIVAKLMEEEFKKTIYKNSPVLKSKALKAWKKEIQKAKKLNEKAA